MRERGKSMADENDAGSDILSMVDILEGGKALEDEATAVLGASDDQNCTYPQGYVYRQALYSCLSCAPEEDSTAGICFACSLHCHDGHNLVELYTKRNFRCDCGNSSFKDFTCKLFSEKEKKNEGNAYNHNFQGKYCTCGRPYPDPDDEIEDEMIQCVICEDWYHTRHLGTLAPVEYEEMICDGCTNKLDFLRWYKSISVKSQDKSPQKKEVKDNETKEKEELDVSNVKDQTPNKEEPSENEISVTTHSGAEDSCPGSSKNDSSSCKLLSLQTGNEGIDVNKVLKSSFWPSQWRKLLCKCSECQKLYKSKGVSFISDEDDTVRAYEDKGRKIQGSDSSFEKGMQALNSMDRINQVEVLTEYNDMKNQLHDFFKSFVGEGKVVKKEDVEEFFAGMTARKRRKLEEGPSFQMHCK